MKVILIKDLAGKGKKGEVIEVNDGYAKNFLIPKKIAVEATKNMLNEIEQKLKKEARLLAEEKKEAEILTQKIEGQTITVRVRCNGDKMHGSVTTIDIANALAEAGFEIDRRKIQLKAPIKELGAQSIAIKTYANMSANIILKVEKLAE